MDNQIVVKEMVSNNATNESFTFSLFHSHRNSVCRNLDPNLRHFTIARQHEQHDQDLCEHELFFDMDISLPFIWGDSHSPVQSCHSLMLQGNPTIEPTEVGDSMEGSVYSPAAEDFDFRLAFSESGSCCNDMMEALSPADDLFYKGQLLPLHLPPRRRMVERLSSLDSNLRDEEEDLDASAMDDVNVGCIPTVAELIKEESHAVPPYKGWRNLSASEDKVRGRKALTLVGSSNAIYAYSREDEHDSSVFPECYKDPALQLIQKDVHQRMERPPSRLSSRSNMGCTVLLPSSKRFPCGDVTIWNENCRGFDLRRAKETRKRGLSMLKLRAPASFFKSLFTSRELKGMFVQQNGSLRHYRSASRTDSLEGEDDDDDEEMTGDHGRHHSSRKHGWSNVDGRPVMVTIKEAHERDKILKKAREYLQKYVKLFKSMYVLLSHTHQEQARNLRLESSSSLNELSTCSSLSSSSSSRARQGSVTYMEPKAVMKNTTLESLRTTSFSKCPRRNCDRTVHVSLVDSKIQRDVMNARFCDGGAAGNTVLHGMSCGTSCLEVENPIQGAIAHCKQSSAISS